MKKILFLLILSLSICCDGAVFIDWIATAGGGGYTASYVSSSTGTGADTDTVVVTAPASITDGDIMVALATSEAGTNAPTCTGWTAISSSDSSLHGSYALYKIASSESGNYTFTFPVSTSGLTVHIYLVKKDGGSWIAPATSGYHSEFTSTTATTVTIPAINVPAGSVYLAIFGNDASYTVSTPPSGMTATPGHATAGTMAGDAYYQEYASSASSVEKTAIWSGESRASAIGIILAAE